jgi:hypothetical protein
MTAAAGNIFEHVLRDAVDEEFMELLALDGVRIECIVSTGQANPPVLSQSQFLLVYTDNLALTSCCRINGLALLPGYQNGAGNAYTSSLRHV